MKTLGTMPGTTGTTFDVVGSFSAGKVGFRSLGGHQYRVRVVPNGKKLGLTPEAGWTQPIPSSSSQNRYSTVVNNEAGLAVAIAQATAALAAQSAQVNVVIA